MFVGFINKRKQEFAQMRWLEVNCSKPLKGNISVPGSKNSSLALLAACCLADGPVVLHNIPTITDIDVVCKILVEIGAKVHRETILVP
jgi:UDP-N-acetylglucosamine enolpyruvyl transferase